MPVAAEDESLFAPTMQVGTNALHRVGVGALRRWMIKGCDIALYAPRGVSRARVLEDIPRCLELHYVHALRPDQFAAAAWDALRRTYRTDELVPLTPRIERLHKLYRPVAKGDRYQLIHEPGVGTHLWLNGDLLGTVAGADFAAAYFGVWLGKEPLDKGLRGDLVKGLKP